MMSRNLTKGRLNGIYLLVSIWFGETAMSPNGLMASRVSALRLQDPFAAHAAYIHTVLPHSDELLPAHNAAFDIRFIIRELRLSGLPALTSNCTMKGYRAL
jgi:hypothetical protein